MENLMIGVLTHHWAKADRVEEAKKLLDGLVRSCPRENPLDTTIVRAVSRERIWSAPPPHTVEESNNG
jgi:hypothetical protein